MAEVTIRSYQKEREREIVSGLKGAMDKIGQLIERDARKNATNPIGGSKHPYVQSGLMSGNVGHITKTEGKEIISEIGFSNEMGNLADIQYAHIIEFGNSRQPPYPFLFPAVEAKKSEIIDILKNSGAKGVSISEA